MPTANAERQRRYRARHFGPSGDMTRLQLCVSLGARDRLDRLAWYYGCGLTELVEKLTAAAERTIEARLTGAALARRRLRGARREG